MYLFPPLSRCLGFTDTECSGGCTGVGSTGQQVTVSIFLTTHIKVTTSLDQHPNKQTPYFRCGGCFGKGHAVGQLSADRLWGGENSKLHNISHNNNSKKNPSIVLKTETINIFNHITTISTHLVDLCVSSAISQLFLGTPVHLQLSHEPIT